MNESTVRIDIVSDIVCPWCAVGFLRLSRALEDLSGQVHPELHWHPFQLNPNMPEGGQALKAHFAMKYGMGEKQTVALGDKLRDIGRTLGFEFNDYANMRIYNTFKAHQLLSWAKSLGKQTDLQRTLFTVYFSEQGAVDQTDVLLDAVRRAGLDSDQALTILEHESYADSVERDATFWKNKDIHAVPAIILDGRSLLSGAQESAFYREQIMRLRTDRQQAEGV